MHFPTIDQLINNSLTSEKLNESQHIFKSCVEAIDDISKLIFDDWNNRKMLSRQTGWSFIADFSNTMKTDKVTDDLVSYPIFLEYQPFALFNVLMSIGDRK